MTSHIDFGQDEEPTSRAKEALRDWSRLLSVYDVLSPRDREALIRLSAAWAECDSDKRVLILELARHLRSV